MDDPILLDTKFNFLIRDTCLLVRWEVFHICQRMEFILWGIVATSQRVDVLQSVELVPLWVGDGANVVQSVKLILGLRIRHHSAVGHRKQGKGEVRPGIEHCVEADQLFGPRKQLQEESFQRCSKLSPITKFFIDAKIAIHFIGKRTVSSPKGDWSSFFRGS